VQINEFVKLGGEQLVPYYADILGAILPCISDEEEKIRVVLPFFCLYYSWDLNCVLINYLLLHCLLGCSWNQRGTTSYEIWSNRGIWHWSDSYNCREVLYSSHWVENLIYLLCIKCCFSYITDYPLHFHVLVGTSVFSKHPICYRLNRCCRKNGMHMLIGVALMCMNAFA
jgi:hypothetical protein